MNDRRGIFAGILARIYRAVTQPWSYPTTDLIWVRTLSGLCFFIREMCARTKQAQPEREDREMKVDFSRHYSQPSSLLSTLLRCSGTRYLLPSTTLLPAPPCPHLLWRITFYIFKFCGWNELYMFQSRFLCDFIRFQSDWKCIILYTTLYSVHSHNSMYTSQYGSLHLWINIIHMGI